MKILFLLSLLAILNSCSVPTPKTAPEHKGVDPVLMEYEEEYLELAAQRGIQFHRMVTEGFATIKPGAVFSVIGVCTYGDGWREVDIDRNFFQNHGYLQVKALVFHELTHCHCGRAHTYGSKANIEYPDGWLDKFIEKYSTKKDDTSIPEAEQPYFKDGCSRSIMNPIVVSETCMYDHYDYYIDEMFNQCRPW